jgi:hypothetical protein
MRVELTTSAMRMRRSSQLSYVPSSQPTRLPRFGFVNHENQKLRLSARLLLSISRTVTSDPIRKIGIDHLNINKNCPLWQSLLLRAAHPRARVEAFVLSVQDAVVVTLNAMGVCFALARALVREA